MRFSKDGSRTLFEPPERLCARAPARDVPTRRSWCPFRWQTHVPCYSAVLISACLSTDSLQIGGMLGRGVLNHPYWIQCTLPGLHTSADSLRWLHPTTCRRGRPHADARAWASIGHRFARLATRYSALLHIGRQALPGKRVMDQDHE